MDLPSGGVLKEGKTVLVRLQNRHGSDYSGPISTDLVAVVSITCDQPMSQNSKWRVPEIIHDF